MPMKNLSGVGIVRGPNSQATELTVQCVLCGWELKLVKADKHKSVAAELGIPYVEWVMADNDVDARMWEAYYDEHAKTHTAAEWLHLIHSLEQQLAIFRSTAENLNEFLDAFVAYVGDRISATQDEFYELINGFSKTQADGVRIPEQFRPLIEPIGRPF